MTTNTDTRGESMILTALRNLEAGLAFFTFQDPKRPELFGYTVFRGPWVPEVHEPEASTGHRAGVRALRWMASQLRGAGLIRVANEVEVMCQGAGRTFDPAAGGRCNQCGTPIAPDADGLVPWHRHPGAPPIRYEIDLDRIAVLDAESSTLRDDVWEAADPIRDAFDVRARLERALELLTQHVEPRGGKQGGPRRARLIDETRTLIAGAWDGRPATWKRTVELWSEAWEIVQRVAGFPPLTDRARDWSREVETFIREHTPEAKLEALEPYDLFTADDMRRALARLKAEYEAALTKAHEVIEGYDPTDAVLGEIDKVLGRD